MKALKQIFNEPMVIFGQLAWLFRTTIVLLLLVNPIYINAQSCGTPENDIVLNKNHSKGGSNSLYKTGCNYNHSITTVCINVYFHIVREDNGSGGFNPNNIDQIVDNLNAAFNEHNIYIHKSGQGFVNDSDYYDLNSLQEFDGLIAMSNMSNSINLYLVNSGYANGSARYILGKYLYIENSWANSAVSPHEIGHCLSLYHTHYGLFCSSSGCPEDISGFNSCECGDFVSDTPADPCLNNNLSANCIYTGGGGYNPDTGNFMAASDGKNCRNHFTEGQADRMKFHIENSTLLQDVVGTSCSIPEILGDDKICNNDIKTFSLVNGGNNVSWNVSSNLNAISSNNTSINVKRANTSVTGYGYIEAVLQHHTIKKDSIWLGKNPQLTLAKLDNGTYLIHGFPNQVCKSEQIKTDISTSGADTITWSLISSSHTTTWSQQGINVSFYLWAPNHTATFRVTLTNDCGTFARNYEFKAKNCSGGGGGDPCGLSFTISQNPVDTEIEIINIPAPCDLNKTGNNGKDLHNTTATLYDLSGNSLQSQTPSVGIMDVQNLKPGLYILVITTNNSKRNHRIIIK